MRFPGFIGGTYTNRSVNADCQRCVNLYPEINEVKNAANGEIAALFSTPGDTLLGTIGTGPIRGTFLAGNGSFFVVSGSGLYQVSALWGGTLLGTLSTTTGRVQFADNGIQLVVTDGSGYVWNYANQTFISLSNFTQTTIVPATWSSNWSAVFSSMIALQATIDAQNVSYLASISAPINAMGTTTTLSGAQVTQAQTAYSSVVTLQQSLESQATSFGISSSAFTTLDADVTALNVYLTGISGWGSGFGVTIVDATWLASWGACFTQLSALAMLLSTTLNGVLTVGQASITAIGTGPLLTTAQLASAKVVYASLVAQQNLLHVEVGAAGTALPATVSNTMDAAVSSLTAYVNTLANWTGNNAWLGSNCVAYLDQWGFFAQPGTNIFYSSNQLDFTSYKGMNVAYKAGFNDPIVSIIADHQYVWVFGQRTSEPWYNAQNAPPGIVLSRVPGALLQIGCCGPNTPQQIMNTLIFLGDGQGGAGVVWQMQGLSPTRISTHPVELALQSYGYSNLQQATAWTYEQDGHGFYCLNVPGAPTTWVFDVVTGLWHERTFLVNGSDQRALPDCHAWFNGVHVVGDYSSGNLYALDLANFTDNGNPIRRMRRSPHFSSDLFRIFYEYFQLDMETGVGLDGSGQGSSPLVMLRYSDDAGHTWSTTKTVSAGSIGGYRARAKWWRLGQSRNRVWEVSITDPVSVTFLGAELGVKKGSG